MKPGRPSRWRGMIDSQRGLRAAAGRRAAEEGVDRLHHAGSTTQPGTIYVGPAMRRVVLILLLLLAGAVVNIAVAWGCALWVDPTQVDDPPVGLIVTDAESWEVMKCERPGLTALATTWAKSASEHTTPPGVYLTHPRSLIPSWGQLGAPSSEFRVANVRPGQLLIEYRDVIGAGWPMRSMWHEPLCTIGDRDHRRVLPSQGGYIRTSLPSWRGMFLRAIPLRPVWPGFAVNTIFYAAILWLLICGPFALRRLIRRRRGLCPACGYDMTHAEHESCPECGTAYA